MASSSEFTGGSPHSKCVDSEALGGEHFITLDRGVPTLLIIRAGRTASLSVGSSFWLDEQLANGDGFGIGRVGNGHLVIRTDCGSSLKAVHLVVELLANGDMLLLGRTGGSHLIIRVGSAELDAQERPAVLLFTDDTHNISSSRRPSETQPAKW